MHRKHSLQTLHRGRERSRSAVCGFFTVEPRTHRKLSVRTTHGEPGNVRCAQKNTVCAFLQTVFLYVKQN